MIQPHSILTFKEVIDSNEFRLREAQIYNFIVCTWSHHDHDDLINSVRFKKEKIRIYLDQLVTPRLSCIPIFTVTLYITMSTTIKLTDQEI